MKPSAILLALTGAALSLPLTCQTLPLERGDSILSLPTLQALSTLEALGGLLPAPALTLRLLGLGERLELSHSLLAGELDQQLSLQHALQHDLAGLHLA